MGAGIIKAFRIITVTALVLWMALIFSLSAETATESSATSGETLKMLLKLFYPKFSSLTSAESEAIISSMQFAVRKTAHFSLYFILGLLAFLSTVSYFSLSLAARTLISAGICLLYAVSDEIHQYFIPGRSCELRDVTIDFCGSALALGLAAGCFLLFKTGRRKHSK